jgi:hypothetical protein
MDNYNNNKSPKNFLKWKFGFVLLLIIGICSSCQLEGEFSELDTYYKVNAQWLYYGGNSADLYSVEILQKNGNTLLDSIQMDTLKVGEKITRSFHFENSPSGATTHLVLKQLIESATAELVIDTVVTLSTEKTFSFVQMTKDSSPFLYTEDTEEAAPDSTNQTKFSYFYSEESLPDSVKLLFYGYNKTTKVLADTAEDSLTVHKDAFSGYITLTQGDHFFRIENAANDSIIQDIKIISSTLPISTATGYSTVLSSTGYKFATAILYKTSGKYTDKLLFSKKW